MTKVLVTFLPRQGSDDKPYMDIHEFDVLGDFITFGHIEAFKVVQVVHSLAQHEQTFCVTAAPAQASQPFFAKSEEARDA